MRRSLLFMLIVCAIYGVGIYQLKYRVAHLESRLSATQRQLINEQESIHILSAEIAYVTRPDHIAKLSEKYLQLSPVKVAQIYELADIMPGVAYSNWAAIQPDRSQKVLASAMVEADDSVSSLEDDVTTNPIAYEVQ